MRCILPSRGGGQVPCALRSDWYNHQSRESHGVQAQGWEFDILMMKQSSELSFSHGALLNAAALLLQGSEHDYCMFHDVDTYLVKAGNIQYNFPMGPALCHIARSGIHPDSRSKVWLLHSRTSVCSCISKQCVGAFAALVQGLIRHRCLFAEPCFC